MIASGITTSSSPAVVRINNGFQVTSSTFSERFKGIRVYTSDKKSISAVVILKYDFRSSFIQVVGYCSFPIHPNNENSNTNIYEYYATSTDYDGIPILGDVDRRSNVLLIGNYEETSVTITPTQNITIPQDFQNGDFQIEVTAGNTHTVTLNTLQSLGFSNYLDLTGTKIVSDKPLTVITGHQCAQVPHDVGFCEPTYVHLPPTFNWGQEFLLAPLATRTLNQHYKVVTSVNSTTVEYRCGTLDSQVLEGHEAGSGLYIVIPSYSYCYLIANQPIFVVQYVPSFFTDEGGDTGGGDTAIAAVAPVSGHVRSTYFLRTSDTFPENFITVTLQAQHFNASQIELDDSILNCTWTEIYNTMNDDVVGHGCTFRISRNVTHAVSHLGENGTLSVLVSGWNLIETWTKCIYLSYQLQFTASVG